MTQTHFHFTLHTHPIHFRSIAAGVARELFPAIFEHPLDLALCPERHLAGISGGDHTSKIHPGRRHHGTVGADGRQDRDHAIFGQLLTLFEHPGIDDAIAGTCSSSMR